MAPVTNPLWNERSTVSGRHDPCIAGLIIDVASARKPPSLNLYYAAIYNHLQIFVPMVVMHGVLMRRKGNVGNKCGGNRELPMRTSGTVSSLGSWLKVAFSK